MTRDDSGEVELRNELADCYRLFDWLGWTELIFNHITVRLLRSDRPEYLINRFGLHYAETTPANLVKISADGEVTDGSRAPVNRAGFVIHIFP